MTVQPTKMEAVECGNCGWSGKRKPGRIIYCPLCGSPCAYQCKPRDDAE